MLKAKLVNADLRGTDLRGVNIRGANISTTLLAGVQWDGAIADTDTVLPESVRLGAAGLGITILNVTQEESVLCEPAIASNCPGIDLSGENHFEVDFSDSIFTNGIFIETNLWISICSALLCLSSAIVLNTEALELPLFIFLATFFTYGSQRIIKNIKSNFYKTKQEQFL